MAKKPPPVLAPKRARKPHAAAPLRVVVPTSTDLIATFEASMLEAVERGASPEDLAHALFATLVAAARASAFTREKVEKTLARYWAIDEIHEEAAHLRAAGRLH